MAVSYSPVPEGPQSVAKFSLGHMEGCAEVNYFDLSVLSCHHDILRLQVAMNEPKDANVVKG